MQTRTKMWIALTIVFVSGIVIGFFGGQVYVRWHVLTLLRRGPAGLQESIVKRVAQRLRVRQDQLAAIEEAVQRATQDVDQLRREHIAAFSTRMKRALSEMRPSLTAEQQRVLDSLDVNDLLPPPVRDFQK